MTAVLFDFSGTLCRIESTESWLRATLAETGTTMQEPQLVAAAAALEIAGALPGGAEPAAVPQELAGVWAERDLVAASHRAAYTGLSRQVPLPGQTLHDALYDRHMTHFVDHLPVDERPDALLPVLDLLKNAELPSV